MASSLLIGPGAAAGRTRSFPLGMGVNRSAVSVGAPRGNGAAGGAGGAGDGGMPPAPAPHGLAGRPPLRQMQQAPPDMRGRSQKLSVSEMMDPALSRGKYPDWDQPPQNVTDAINSGSTVFGWANNSGVGPGTRGYQGSYGGVESDEEYQGQQQGQQQPPQPFHTQRPASEVSGHARRRTSQIRPLAPTFYADGTAPTGPVPPGQIFVAGDPQKDGKPNPELIVPAPGGGHDVIPLKNVPKEAQGTHPIQPAMPKVPLPAPAPRPPMGHGRTRGLDDFYRLNPLTPKAANKEAEKLIMHPEIPMPIRVPHYAYGTRPRRHGHDEDTRAPVSRAGRTAGLSQLYHNNTALHLERGARGAIDPITGLSQTPTEREVAHQLNMLSRKGAEFDGYSGLDEAMLLADYYEAKRSGDPARLEDATQAVMAYKDRLNALRAQAARQPQAAPSVASQVGRQTIGESVQPARVTDEPEPAGGLAPATLIPGLASPTPQLEDRSITTPYGKGSISFRTRNITAPTGESVRTAPPAFNLSNTYDPTFATRMKAMDEAGNFEATQEMPKPEGSGFTAVVPTEQQALKYQKDLGESVSKQNALADQQDLEERQKWQAEAALNEASARAASDKIAGRSRFEENIVRPIVQGADMVGNTVKGAWDWAFGNRPVPRTRNFSR